MEGREAVHVPVWMKKGVKQFYVGSVFQRTERGQRLLAPSAAPLLWGLPPSVRPKPEVLAQPCLFSVFAVGGAGLCRSASAGLWGHGPAGDLYLVAGVLPGSAGVGDAVPAGISAVDPAI